MPRPMVSELTVAKLEAHIKDVAKGKKPPGYLRVGKVGGLCLQVRVLKGNVRCSWILRRTINGKRQDLGLGVWPEVDLAMARRKAEDVLYGRWVGKDAFAEAAAQKAKGLAFRECAARYATDRLAGRDPKDMRAWHSAMERYAMPTLGDMLVANVTTAEVLTVLQQELPDGKGQLWMAQNDTANRLLGELRAVLAWATVHGLRKGDNPAVWKGHLDKILPSPNKVRKGGNQPALPYAQLPAFMASLRAREVSASQQALIFLVLTAARSGEVRGATWDEVDLERGMWTIPASRMKADKDHRVALSADTVALLEAQPRFAGTNLIFPGRSLTGPMSDNTLNVLIEKMDKAEVKAGRVGWKDPRSGSVAVPHGMRSTFRDWAAEQTDFPADMVEMALAHTVGSAVERAYRRTDLFEKRRELMDAWAKHCCG